MRRRLRPASLALMAVWLACTPALGQGQAAPPAEPALHERVLEGTRSFFRKLFGGADEPPGRKPAATPAGAPQATPDARPAARSAPAPALADTAVTPNPTPVAQAAPGSLHAALARGDNAAALRMIEAGADLEAKDGPAGASVLHYAVMKGRMPLIDLLISRGADVNSRTRNGTTPLHTAVAYARREVAELLIENGADVNARSTGGATPLALALEARNGPLGEALKERGARE
jgi:hypothetical protein